MLRPGEKLVVMDVGRFARESKLTEQCSSASHDVESLSLFQRLSGMEKFADFFVVDAFLYSRDCPPISRRVNVVWFNTGSLEELIVLVSRAEDAFWAGRYPKAGIYWKGMPWKKNWISKECAELIIPSLNRVRCTNGRDVYLEAPMESAGALVRIVMPSWNYYSTAGIDLEGYRVKTLSWFHSLVKRRKRGQSNSK